MLDAHKKTLYRAYQLTCKKLSLSMGATTSLEEQYLKEITEIVTILTIADHTLSTATVTNAVKKTYSVVAKNIDIISQYKIKFTVQELSHLLKRSDSKTSNGNLNPSWGVSFSRGNLNTEKDLYNILKVGTYFGLLKQHAANKMVMKKQWQEELLTINKLWILEYIEGFDYELVETMYPGLHKNALTIATISSTKEESYAMLESCTFEKVKDTDLPVMLADGEI